MGLLPCLTIGLLAAAQVTQAIAGIYDLTKYYFPGSRAGIPQACGQSQLQAAGDCGLCPGAASGIFIREGDNVRERLRGVSERI